MRTRGAGQPHNAAISLAKRLTSGGLPDNSEGPHARTHDRRVHGDEQIAAASLHTFMRLPAAQRSSVILMDVLGYSLEEIGDVIGSSIPAAGPRREPGLAYGRR